MAPCVEFCLQSSIAQVECYLRHAHPNAAHAQHELQELKLALNIAHASAIEEFEEKQ